ncbi:MAG TPA: hypothetical protein DDW27_14225 [Bacteroidales bacterium]|nr:hypothetical protein [Bacteroidales bacterium]
MFFFSGILFSLNAQVKITDGPVLTLDPNSLLELESTNKGLLIPRIAINSLILPAPLTAPVPVGMIVYSLGGSIADGFYHWNGTAWIPFATGITSQWTTNGTSIYYNTGNVGIGTTVPSEQLEVIGNVKIGNATTGTIRATKELVLRQDGDVYGPSVLRLRNRTAENGAIFETTDATFTLVDFIFRNFLHQRNIRLESRAAYAKTGAPSFHLGGLNPDGPTLSLGDNYAAFSKNVRIGDYVTPLTALDVNGQITLRSGASAGAVLVSDANGTGTWTNSGSIYNVPVTKSVSSTLLKTETVVLASGNITLTLPSVTGADDGLAITVKNTGNYTDLITVIPEAGKTIDADTASFLTRWRGRTYIATGSNWIRKDRETRADNLFDVGPAASFATIAEVVEFLNIHMTGPSVVRLGGGTFKIDATQTINLPYPLTFEGISFGESMIEAAAGVTGSPLFICETECYFKMLTFSAVSSAAGNDAIHFTGSETYHEVKDCVFDGFNKGIVTTNNTDLWIFENDYENCAGAGVEIAAGAASGGRLRISETDFGQCAIGINLLSGVSETVSIISCAFYNTAGGSDIGILYNPAGFTSFETIAITNTAWNNQGTYISGFDFTRPDGRDADAFIKNNTGMEDHTPHCNISVVNNSLTTTCTTANAWYKINWVTTSSSTTKLLLNNNQITYQPSNSNDITFFISGNLSVDNNNRNITIGLVKNGVTGTRYGGTTLRISTANQPYQFSTIIHLEDIVKGDFFEFYCSSATSSTTVIFQDINILVDSK